MPRTGPAYERPSRVSLALYVCFSLAVAVMAGWLVMMILSSNDANTKAADPTADRAADAADVVALAATSAPQVQNVLPSDATPAAASAGMPPAPADGAPSPAVPQARPLASASAGPPPAPGAPSTGGAEDRATSFQAVSPGEAQHYSGEALMVSAYVILWVILLVWVALLGRKQSSLDARLSDLERVLAKAAPERGGLGKEAR